jgi:hypothetical protein
MFRTVITPLCFTFTSTSFLEIPSLKAEESQQRMKCMLQGSIWDVLRWELDNAAFGV